MRCASRDVEECVMPEQSATYELGGRMYIGDRAVKGRIAPVCVQYRYT